MTGFWKNFVAVVMLSLAILVTSEENYEVPISLESRIIGGDLAEERQFPYYVRVIAYGGPTSEKRLFRCGGSIIGPNWVLTAGHCYAPTNKTSGFITYRIEAGSIVSGEPRQFDIVPNDHAYRHPDYQEPPELENDIALMKTNEWIFDVYVSPIEIALGSWSAESYEGETITAVGYGYTSSDGPVSEELRWTELTVIRRRRCKRTFNNLPDTVFCAVDQKNNPNEHATCDGDSGGPVVIRRNGKWVEIGLVSIGTTECINGPGGYTNIAIFYDWIMQTMEEDSYQRPIDSGIHLGIDVFDILGILL